MLETKPCQPLSPPPRCWVSLHQQHRGGRRHILLTTGCIVVAAVGLCRFLTTFEDFYSISHLSTTTDDVGMHLSHQEKLRRRFAKMFFSSVIDQQSEKQNDTSQAASSSLFSLLPAPWRGVINDATNITNKTTLMNMTDTGNHTFDTLRRPQEWIVDLENDYNRTVYDDDPEVGRILDKNGELMTVDPTKLLRRVSKAAMKSSGDPFLSLLKEHNETVASNRSNCIPFQQDDPGSAFPEEEAMGRLRLARVTASNFSYPRLLCAVYSHNNTDSERLDTVLRTWAPRCDGFFIGSDVTDIANRMMVKMERKGNEEYDNMWNKVRSMMVYMYKQHFHSYDWFHIGGDDMYVVVENLKGLLSCPDMVELQYHGVEKPQQQRPIFLGDTICNGGDPALPYNTGGPGYTLNRAALHLLVTKALPNWHSRRTSTEDVQTATAFREVLGILPTPARERVTGQHYYNTFSPGRHFANKEAGFYRNKYTRPMNFTWGENHTAVYPAAFHYMSAPIMRRLHWHLYYSAANNTDACDEKEVDYDAHLEGH